MRDIALTEKLQKKKEYMFYPIYFFVFEKSTWTPPGFTMRTQRGGSPKAPAPRLG